MAQSSELSPGTRGFIRAVDRFAAALALHWLLCANLILVIFAGLPFLAPILMHYGYEAPARLIYTVYSYTCHQLAYRSFFLFGAQSSYTVEELQRYLHVSNPALDLFYWRDWLGSAALGYKTAFCERDAAIYLSMLAAGLVFGMVRTRVKALDWKWYLVLAIAPMALDGGTQLIMLRESTALLRTVTGILFGALSVWLIYPNVQEAMQDIGRQSALQLSKLSHP